MRIRFLGAAQTVTGSCHLLEIGSKRIMVDCGMFQGSRPIRERNYQSFLVPPNSVDCVLLTHAHIDHSGLLPKLVKHGFSGPIYATQATGDLLEVMLPDSGHIQEVEVERKNRKARRAGKKLIEPIYTVDDAYKTISFVRKVKYNEVFRLDNNITARFLDAGHILGSAILELWIVEGTRQTKLVFTGDLGNLNAPFVNDPAAVEEADYVIMESTYGNRLHKDRENKLELLKEVIHETYQKGGNLVIPAFAVERTQDLLYDLNQLARSGQLPPMKVYIDSPMAVAATNIFKKHPECFDEETRLLIREGFNPLALPGLTFSVTADESKAINEISGGAIILSASGMCDAGRIKHHLKHNLWRPESTILFVGYQASGTKGQRLLAGEKTIRIHGEEIAVRADIRNIDGFSAHADQKGLLNWVRQFKTKPKRIFVVHGEPESSATLAELITKETGIATNVPVWQQEVELTQEEPLTREDIQKAYNAVFEKIQALLDSGSGTGKYAEILNRLNNLENYLSSCSK
ncbi:MBL fold metallo-hydrolase RNA specificity domain-containing protein [Desulfolucanica intricata]|uniref:MBL fold metallo-hydrolase RNA specificity domain-containing protein n=1 Tax=Desulfolucanica intricata TaxID=1285191 RepID=UPI0008328316|nr:MBL fold metallo-hydrolase [Desulfolucanica intricata]